MQSDSQGLWSCLEEVEASYSLSGPCSCRLVGLSKTALEVSEQADGTHPTLDCFQPARQTIDNRTIIIRGINPCSTI